MNDRSDLTDDISIDEWKINLAKSYFEKEKDSLMLDKKIDSNSLDDSVYHDDDQEEEDFCVITKDEGLRRRNKKTIEVDPDFVNAIYDNELVKTRSAINSNPSLPVLKSPPSLRKLASSKMSMSNHNDSGIGLDSGYKSPRNLGSITEETTQTNMPPHQAELPLQSTEDRCFTEIFDRHARESFHIVEYAIVLVMVCSILVMVFMGDLEEDRTIEPSYGGKRAAIQYYYDKMNSNKYFF